MAKKYTYKIINTTFTNIENAMNQTEMGQDGYHFVGSINQNQFGCVLIMEKEEDA